MYACVKFINECAGHSNKVSYIVPLTHIEIETVDYIKNKSYSVKCPGDKNKLCSALISFIEKGTISSFSCI